MEEKILRSIECMKMDISQNKNLRMLSFNELLFNFVRIPFLSKRLTSFNGLLKNWKKHMEREH